MPEPEKVSEEQASDALQQLIGAAGEAEPQAAPEEAAPEARPEETSVKAEPEAATEAVAEEATEEDIESLRKRLKEAQATHEEFQKSAQARADAMQKRFSQNEQILRERYVKKAGVVERARDILKRAKSESGVDPADVDQVLGEIDATMNPASASYAPPRERTVATEDQAIILNSFLNEKAMSETEADEFGSWMQKDASTQMSPIEQAVAERDLDGFLRIAHNRFLEGRREKEKAAIRNDAVGAVKSVQRTQREAARAASSAPVSPKKPTAKAATVDPKKLTPDDVSTLLRQTVEQYR